MTMVVVDGQAWSGREEVALMLSRALRCPAIGASELAQRAELLGYDRQEFLERVERPYGFLSRMLEYLAYVGAGTPDSGSPLLYRAWSGQHLVLPQLPLGPARLRDLLSRLVCSLGPGHTVLVGCGVQGVLEDAADVVSVFLAAPEEVRSERAELELEISVEEARRRVRQMDNVRRAFFRQMFRLSWEDPSIYDLVLDTGVLGYDDAVTLILKKMGVAPDAAREGVMVLDSEQVFVVQGDGRVLV